jgi:Polysaccharide pyruvyl transferase
MKIGIFKYALSRNLGDEVQSLAVAQHVNVAQILYVDRDKLNSYDGEPCVVVMNGWFSKSPENFPPSDKITPIFFGFHMIDRAVETYRRHVDYFKKHEPIGCRDESTAAILRSWGVVAYFSGCATMTFPKRLTSGFANTSFAIDIDKRSFVKPLRKVFQFGTQDASVELFSAKTKLDLTKELLDIYKTRAKLIVTSRIHCAMPCAAMGIPVLYVGPSERRTAIIDFLGIPKKQPGFFTKLNEGHFPTEPINIDDKRKKIAEDLRSKLSVKKVELVHVTA